VTKPVTLPDMSFAKAGQLLRLATLVASRHMGVTLDDVVHEFPGSLRTAKRMMRALEAMFPETEDFVDGEGRKRWRLRSSGLANLLTLSAEEIAAIELAEAVLVRRGDNVEADRVRSLRRKVLALVPRNQVARLETDHDALLEAQGLVARPGPRTRIDPDIARTVGESIKACCVLEIVYRSRKDPKPRRRLVAPYGILSGLRKYLVAADVAAKDGPPRTYRFDAIRRARLTDKPFIRPADFDLQRYANRAFGSFHNPAEFQEVVWRFSPAAAEQAAGFEFHPDQQLEMRPDGSLIVRFTASGHLEMCWHLYAWGDQVEVLAPTALRDMCKAHRRTDFAALP
jgi:predicted DNA-binding transcriptional regulator YafY